MNCPDENFGANFGYCKTIAAAQLAKNRYVLDDFRDFNPND